MISRFNLDQKRLTFYENPELFHKEFTELISSNNHIFSRIVMIAYSENL